MKALSSTNTNETNPPAQQVRDEVIEALDDLQHAFALALDTALKNDVGDCATSARMLRDFDALSSEIQQAKHSLNHAL